MTQAPQLEAILCMWLSDYTHIDLYIHVQVDFAATLNKATVCRLCNTCMSIYVSINIAKGRYVWCRSMTTSSQLQGGVVTFYRYGTTEFVSQI